MSDGEIAVRQDGHEHAVDAPRLNGQLHIDLDHVEVPRVRLPEEVVVEYQEDEDIEDDLQTDGGETVERTYVEMGGSETISDDLAIWAIIAAGALLMSSGYLFTVESTISGLIAGGSGILLGYLAIPTFWRDGT